MDLAGSLDEWAKNGMDLGRAGADVHINRLRNYTSCFPRLSEPVLSLALNLVLIVLAVIVREASETRELPAARTRNWHAAHVAGLRCLMPSLVSSVSESVYWVVKGSSRLAEKSISVCGKVSRRRRGFLATTRKPGSFNGPEMASCKSGELGEG